MSRQIGVKRRKQYDTKLLEEAVMLIKNKNISLNKASEIYSIPKATLSYKVNGKLPLLCKSGPCPVLTENEEAKLADWACKMAAIGFGRTRNELLDTVQKILERDQRPNPFKNNRPGKDWYYAFIKRNPVINERTPQQLAKERAVITPQKVELWFSDLKNYIDLDIKDPSLWTDPSRWFNADESGFPLCPKSGKVLAPRGVPSIYNFTSSDKSQVTVLACMSASGHFLKPLIVFPGQRFSYNPLDGFPEAVMGRTATGWMDKELFYTWMKDVFIPHINVSGVKKPALLLVDGHSTHLTLEVCDLCRENGVELYCFLAHASHIIQPCDLRLFNCLKDSWRQAVRDYQLQNIGEYVTKTKFASVFRNAWMKSTTPDVAVKAFKESGLFPFNPSKPLSTVKMQPSYIFQSSTSSCSTVSLSSPSALPQRDGALNSSGNSSCNLSSVSSSNMTESAVLPSASSSKLPESAALPSASYFNLTGSNTLPSASNMSDQSAALLSPSAGNMMVSSELPLTKSLSENAVVPSKSSAPLDKSPACNLKTSTVLHVTSNEASFCSSTMNTMLSTPMTASSTSSSVSPAFDELLQIPVVKTGKSTKKALPPLPKAITSEKFREILIERQKRKDDEQKAKEARKKQREEKKKAKEEEKVRKQKERETKKMLKKQKQKKSGKKGGKKRGNGEISESDEEFEPPLADSDDEEMSTDYTSCAKCLGKENNDAENWIGCTKCPRWMHKTCVTYMDLTLLDNETLEALEFECDYC